VQELAASASFIKDMVGEIRTIVKEAHTQQYNNYNYAETPTTTIKEPKKVNQIWDLPTIWDSMMRKLPTGFQKNGVGVYKYEHTENIICGKNVKTTISISFDTSSIDMRIRIGNNTSVAFYLYKNAKDSWFDGINSSLIKDLVDELPDDVKEFVDDFVKKVLNK
jgi:hypothetical protein